MSAHTFLNPWDLVSFAECLISAGVGAAGLCVALSLKHQNYLKGSWYFTLRWILTLLSIAGLSNAWSLLLLESVHAKPTELLVNFMLLSLLVWIGCFYRFELATQAGDSCFEKVVKFFHGRISMSPPASG